MCVYLPSTGNNYSTYLDKCTGCVLMVLLILDWVMSREIHNNIHVPRPVPMTCMMNSSTPLQMNTTLRNVLRTRKYETLFIYILC